MKSAAKRNLEITPRHKPLLPLLRRDALPLWLDPIARGLNFKVFLQLLQWPGRIGKTCQFIGGRHRSNLLSTSTTQVIFVTFAELPAGSENCWTWIFLRPPSPTKTQHSVNRATSTSEPTRSPIESQFLLSWQTLLVMVANATSPTAISCSARPSTSSPDLVCNG